MVTFLPSGILHCSVRLLGFFFLITCLCSFLLGPPASQGAPLLECRCCHCHTCTTHRPSFLPLHSVSPGIQVLLFPFLYENLWSPRICLHTKTCPPPFSVFVVIKVPQGAFCLHVFISTMIFFPSPWHFVIFHPHAPLSDLIWFLKVPPFREERVS